MPLFVLMALILLTGCAGVLPSGPEQPATTFVLDPDLPAAAKPGAGSTVLVSPPDAAPGFATPRMAYLRERYRVDYYAYHEWVDTPGAMLAPVLAAALRGSGRFAGVVDDPRAAVPDLRLDVRVDHLHQDFRHQPSIGSVALTVSAVDLAQGSLLATRTFQAAEPAPSDDAYGGVVAVNRALSRLLPEVAAFAASQAKRVRPIPGEP